MLFPLTKLGWMTEKFECLARGYLLFARLMKLVSGRREKGKNIVYSTKHYI
jgi:hypothetical protein